MYVKISLVNKRLDAKINADQLLIRTFSQHFDFRNFEINNILIFQILPLISFGADLFELKIKFAI